MVRVAMVAPAVSPRAEAAKQSKDTITERSPKSVAEFESHCTPAEDLGLSHLSSLSDREATCTSAKTFLTLPTLKEIKSASSSEVGETEERDELREDENDSNSPQLNSASDSPRGKLREKPPVVRTTKDEFMKLKTSAADLASRGNEAEALKTYAKALRLMRSDLAKIKRSIKNALESTIASMQSQLYEAWVQVASEIAEIRTTMAILSERLGDYETAIRSCEEARIVYQSYANLKTKVKIGKKDRNEQLEQMEHMLERLALAKASYSDRKLLHQEAVHVQTCLAGEVDPEAKEDLYNELFDVLTTVLELEQDSLGKIHPQVADTVAMIAKIYGERGEKAEALETMHSAVSIMRLALGPVHPRTAAALCNLAELYGPEDSERAIQVSEAAIDAFLGSRYGNYHAMIGSTLNNIGVIYIRRGDLDRAVQKLSDALASYESGVGQGSAINPEIAQVWKNLGECYSLRREWESALFAYTSALGVQQDARRCHDVLDLNSMDVSVDSPENSEGSNDPDYADTMVRLAKATAEVGQYDEAVQSYEEALHVYRLMLHKATMEAEGRLSADMIEAQDRVAHTLYCIGQTQEKNVQYDEAIALYTESFDLRLRSDAVREHRRANMIHCAMCLAGIGSVHMRQLEYTDACLVLKESLHFLEAHGVPRDHEIFDIIARRLAVAERGFLASSSFAEDDGNDSATVYSAATGDTGTAIKEDRTLALDMDAQRQTEAGDYSGAIRTLTKALAIRRKRLTKRLKNNRYQRNLKERNDVAKTIGNFAAVHFMKGEVKQAEALFVEAVRVYRSNGTEDSHPCIQGLLQSLQEVHESLTC